MPAIRALNRASRAVRVSFAGKAGYAALQRRRIGQSCADGRFFCADGGASAAANSPLRSAGMGQRPELHGAKESLTPRIRMPSRRCRSIRGF
jgi:hypothetical protein